jgi:predicted dehydrogenase
MYSPLLFTKNVFVVLIRGRVNHASELVVLAEEQQRVLMVGHTFEYSPAVNELRKLVQSGDLGKIYCIEAERVNLGLFRSDGNVIWDLAPHDLSILLYIPGKSPEQIRVQAHADLQPHIHDIAHLDLEFADGMTAHIHVSKQYLIAQAQERGIKNVTFLDPISHALVPTL